VEKNAQPEAQSGMTYPHTICPAVTRRVHCPGPDTIRLWTIQPPHIWNALQEQGWLLVDPNHSEFADHRDDFPDAYEWMRVQMAQRIPGYAGYYPWWAYQHFLDLRFYRWHTAPHGQRLMRLELAVPEKQVILSAYGAWHSVLGGEYLPEAVAWEDAEQELNAWQEARTHQNLNRDERDPRCDPWKTQMQASWERIFDVEARRPTETIQATFECLKLAEVVKVTEFTSMPECRRYP